MNIHNINLWNVERAEKLWPKAVAQIYSALLSQGLCIYIYYQPAREKAVCAAQPLAFAVIYLANDCQCHLFLLLPPTPLFFKWQNPHFIRRSTCMGRVWKFAVNFLAALELAFVSASIG